MDSSVDEDQNPFSVTSPNSSNEVDSRSALLIGTTTDNLIDEAYFYRRFVSVADLSSHEDSYLEKKFNVYSQLTLTVALFYVIPVIQLVLQYQSTLSTSGNEDMCYFNFLCTRKYLSITAFNNVFSNIGYCILGLFYLLIVICRDQQYSYVRWIRDFFNVILSISSSIYSIILKNNQSVRSSGL
ncbi:hypothetical protein ACOME3_010647 [Neoechinorhynchus agilis]